jgi:ribonuclease P protein component
LEKKVRYTLGKNERLKSRKAIDLLFKEGKSFSVFPFKIVWKATANEQQTTNNGSLQAAVSVSKRYFKKATERNRIKRLMREAYRLQKNNLQDTLEQTNQQAVVFILYIGNEVPVYDVVKEKINAALKKLQKIIHEAPAANS